MILVISKLDLQGFDLCLGEVTTVHLGIGENVLRKVGVVVVIGIDADTVAAGFRIVRACTSLDWDSTIGLSNSRTGRLRPVSLIPDRHFRQIQILRHLPRIEEHPLLDTFTERATAQPESFGPQAPAGVPSSPHENTMEVIRFHCPACLTSLTVPPTAAGIQGPCPKCAVEIIGPNPALGLPAVLPQNEPPARDFDPFPDAIPPATPITQIPQPPELIPPTDPFAGIAPSSKPSDVAPPESKQFPIKEPPIAPGPIESEVPEETVEPFKDFTPPAPKPATPAIPYPAPRNTSQSVAFLVLSCLLCLVIAFVAGYTLARRIPEPGGPIFPSKTNDTPASVPEPIPVPVRTWIPNTAPIDSQEQKIAGPEATLKAFLNAEGWASRSSYVKFAESIRPQMEERSKLADDGPIETTGISLFEVTEQAHIFQVATPEIPEGFPVAVARDNNSWLIDWQSFIEFHDDLFQRFAAGETGEHGVFHLLVKPVESNDEEALFEKFLLNPPMPGRQQTAYVAKESVVLARIRSLFDRQAGLSDEVFAELLEDRGPPMILALSYRTNSNGQSFLQIDDVIAVGWGPGVP